MRSLLKSMGKTQILTSLALSGLILISPLACQNQTETIATNCQPTAPDELGPFYRSGAPLRASVGKGFRLRGTVRSASECRPLTGANIELWLVNEAGDYDDAHRATVITDRKGRYSFESNRPTDYVGRLPHIHIKVTAKDHEALITQYYPAEGQSAAVYDLILPAIND